jgi:hypothetical protein
LNSEPQNIEYRTAECRRVESLRSIILKLREFIPSTFVIHNSIFFFHTFSNPHLPSFPPSAFRLPNSSVLCLPSPVSRHPWSLHAMLHALSFSPSQLPNFFLFRLPPSAFPLPNSIPSHLPSFPPSASLAAA